jgi:hypothetical protein
MTLNASNSLSHVAQCHELEQYTRHKIIQCRDESTGVQDARFIGLIDKFQVKDIPDNVTRGWMEQHCIHCTNWSPILNRSEDIQEILSLEILRLANLPPARKPRPSTAI